MKIVKLLTLYDKILIVLIIIISLVTIFLYPFLMVKETNGLKDAVINMEDK